jgi:hypothetical protein
MRTNKKEIMLRHPAKYDTRDEILRETPQEFGGCLGCKYFNACHGGCPSQTIDDDWRNRSYLCSLYKTLFQFYEKTLGFFGLYPPHQRTVKEKERNESNKRHKDPSHGDWPNHKDSGRGNRVDHRDAHGDSN